MFLRHAREWQEVAWMVFNMLHSLLKGHLGLALAPFENGLEKRDCSLHSSLYEFSGAILFPSGGR